MVITGLGVVTPFGGLGPLRQAIRDGLSAVRPVTRFSTEGLSCQVAALVADTPQMQSTQPGPGQDLMVEFAVRAGRGALEDAPSGVGLVLGTNIEDRPEPYESLLQRIGDGLDLRGPRLATSLACASSASAIGLAASLVQRGDVEAMLAGGSDVITPWVMAGFDCVGALAPGRGTPFGEQRGLSLGEGAAFLLLESEEAALARGAVVLARLSGWGLAADGHHVTAPAPDGRGVAAAIRRTGAVDCAYVNAHGTGTEANDVPEGRGIRAAVGDVPVASLKGVLGHAQGAASALELVACLLQPEVPPNLGTETLRAGVPSILQQPMDRPECWVKTASAFGGTNVALCIGGAVNTEKHPVYIGRTHQIWDFDREQTEAACRRSDLSREDRLGVAAVWLAWAALGRVPRSQRARTGLILGLRGASRETNEVLQSEIEHGLTGLRAATFSRASMVAAAGLVSREVGLQGPVDVVSAGQATGLLAVAHAAEQIRRGHADVMVALVTGERGGRALRLGHEGARLSGWAVGTDPERTAGRISNAPRHLTAGWLQGIDALEPGHIAVATQRGLASVAVGVAVGVAA